MKEFRRMLNLRRVTSDSLYYCLCFSEEHTVRASTITTWQISDHDFKVSMPDTVLVLGCHCAAVIKFTYAQSPQVFRNYHIVMPPPPKSLIPAKSAQMLCLSTPCYMLSLCSPPSFSSGLKLNQFQHFELRLPFPLGPVRFRTTPSGMAPGSCWELTTYA
jgi:hypothetical protein